MGHSVLDGHFLTLFPLCCALAHIPAFHSSHSFARPFYDPFSVPDLVCPLCVSIYHWVLSLDVFASPEWIPPRFMASPLCSFSSGISIFVIEDFQLKKNLDYLLFGAGNILTWFWRKKNSDVSFFWRHLEKRLLILATKSVCYIHPFHLFLVHIGSLSLTGSFVASQLSAPSAASAVAKADKIQTKSYLAAFSSVANTCYCSKNKVATL